jgi:phosphoenolpyruvate carboxylase
MPESTAYALQGEQPKESGVTAGAGRLLQNRLVLVEDLWQTVLRSECLQNKVLAYYD